jgi:hypothetical protein
MLQADDLAVGQFVTVLHGELVPQVIGPAGMFGRELHYDLKGIPLAVLSVDLPYFLASIVPAGQLRVMDIREVCLMKLTDRYVEDFRVHVSAMTLRTESPVVQMTETEE